MICDEERKIRLMTRSWKDGNDIARKAGKEKEREEGVELLLLGGGQGSEQITNEGGKIKNMIFHHGGLSQLFSL